jgi:transcriptional regulator EpsA
MPEQMMRTNNPEWHVPAAVLERASLTEEERDRLLHVVERVSSLETHYELFVLAQGEIQDFLPHRILISVWGDFATGDLGLDILSAEPVLRTADMDGCAIYGMVEGIYSSWVAGERRPLLVEGATSLCCQCTPFTSCEARDVLRAMRYSLIHGIKNGRDGTESLYLMLNRQSDTIGESSVRRQQMAELLIPQIDLAFRRISAWKPIEFGADNADSSGAHTLSVREQEVMDLICAGKPSAQVANILCISLFTVKNHLHRIYEKLGATNRTEAALRYCAVGRPWVGHRIPRGRI